MPIKYATSPQRIGYEVDILPEDIIMEVGKQVGIRGKRLIYETNDNAIAHDWMAAGIIKALDESTKGMANILILVSPGILKQEQEEGV